MQSRRNLLKQAGVALTFGVGFVTQAKAIDVPSNCVSYTHSPYNYTLDRIETNANDNTKMCWWKKPDGSESGIGCN